MDEAYRIVFSGDIHESLTPARVRDRVARHLKLSPAQIDKLFSGRHVVLKNGIDATAARGYVDRLKRLGMRVRVEAVAKPKPANKAPAETEWNDRASIATLARTHMNLDRAEALLNGTASLDAEATEPPEPSEPEPVAKEAEAPAAISAAPAHSPPEPQGQTPSLLFSSAEPGNSLTLSGTFLCSHCGSEHQIEAHLKISTPFPRLNPSSD